eukprot:COSAG01_NODE_23222_length_823_cov_1.102210_1_plen_25_part_10
MVHSGSIIALAGWLAGCPPTAYSGA